MIEREKKELYVARQLFKHDNRIYFRIFVSARPFPKTIPWEHSSGIYDLSIDTTPPYRLYLNHQFMRTFETWESAFEILLERVASISRLFGFGVLWAWKQLRNWRE